MTIDITGLPVPPQPQPQPEVEIQIDDHLQTSTSDRDFDYRPEPVPLTAYEAEVADRPPLGDRHSGWEFIDLGPVLSGEHVSPVPEYGLRTDGAGLLYRGRVHGIYGEPGSGKTWLALAQCVERIRAGSRVLIIDYEDTPDAAVNRLRLLGLTDDEIAGGIIYVRPTGPLIDRAGRIDVTTIERLKESATDLVIIDSAGEALALEGLDQNNDAEVATWFRRLPRMLTALGATVVVLDHVTKNREGRGAFAIGSHRKLAAIDGAAYGVEVRTAPTKHRDGRLRLICAKDRHGTYQRGTIVAEVLIRAGDPLEVVLTPPAEKFRPTGLMESVSRYLEGVGSSTAAGIDREVHGKAEYVRIARDALVDEGFVTVDVTSKQHRYTSVRPFRDDDPNEPRPTSSPPRPTDSGRGGHTPSNPPRPLVPPLRGTRDEGTRYDGPADDTEQLDLVPVDTGRDPTREIGR